MPDIQKITLGNKAYDVKDSYVRSQLPTVQSEVEKMRPYKLGLQADFENSTFTRLGDAVGLSGGSDFDNFPMYQRRRCNLADDGTVNAYFGDENYVEDGSNGQVMVEQPVFYYKVEILKQTGNNIDKANYWVSNAKLDGFKLHPAFRRIDSYDTDEELEVKNGAPYFYEGAYEASVDGSNKIQSITGVAPKVNATRANFRTYASNRGSNWRQNTFWIESADQLLMVIEYGQFNMQDAIGLGNTRGSSAINTGTLAAYGNGSYGDTTGTTGCQWRGKENPWGNVWEWVDGINIISYIPYIANSYTFADNTTTNYTSLNFTVTKGWISKFGINKTDFDWCFIANECSGSSSVPVGDYQYRNSGNRVVGVGGTWGGDLGAGPFGWGLTSSSSDAHSSIGGRAAWISS